MKIRISVSEEKRRDVTDFMHAHGIETGEDADFILTESDRFPAFLSVRNDKKEHVTERDLHHRSRRKYRLGKP
ncbi:MAG: hypothetical protein K5697_09935 [Lachnospiraceae bacterium]|nr:hypothetical protein [Lachnospiraceae bacterium]